MFKSSEEGTGHNTAEVVDVFPEHGRATPMLASLRLDHEV